MFLGTADCDDFLRRLGAVTDAGKVDGLRLDPGLNPFQLVVRTGPVPLASVMWRRMAGYAVAFNRRHKRHGHLFQNRYNSILCDEEEYLLERVCCVGQNPLRAGFVKSLEELDRHPDSRHCALMGRIERPWQAAGLEEGEIWTAARRRAVDEARRAFRQVAVRKVGFREGRGGSIPGRDGVVSKPGGGKGGVGEPGQGRFRELSTS